VGRCHDWWAAVKGPEPLAPSPTVVRCVPKLCAEPCPGSACVSPAASNHQRDRSPARRRRSQGNASLSKIVRRRDAGAPRAMRPLTMALVRRVRRSPTTSGRTGRWSGWQLSLALASLDETV
jgi:hypothetical protein